MNVRPNTEPALRRGACPGLADPMPTGDGLLARLACAGAAIELDAMAALCAAARRHGNGIIEITARGSIQVRGLRPAAVAPFAQAVAALGIDAGERIPILVDPLAGLEGAPATDARGLAGAIRERLAEASLAAAPGPKVSIVIDGGHALHLDAVRADVRLRTNGTRWQIGLGGDAATATWLGSVANADVAEAAARLIETIAQHGPQARARDLLRARGEDPFRVAVADLLVDLAPIASRPSSEPIGTHPLQDGRLGLGVGLAFGHSDADALDRLVEAACRAGASQLRTAPGRALIIIGLTGDAPRTLSADADELGFITRRNDPRRKVVACAGAPVCAAAEIASRSLAPLVAAAAAPMLDGSLALHLSGCRKGCAHPGAAALTIVGRDGGCGLVIDGSARDHPAAGIASETLPAGFAGLAAEVVHARPPDGTCAEGLARLGADRVAAILGGSHG